MLATPAVSQILFSIAAPSFLVVRGIVHWDQGGMHGVLAVGQTLSYRRHGTYTVEYVGDSYAVIHHTTVTGQTRKVFIPPQRRLVLSNGRFEIVTVNYQSFVDYFSRPTPAYVIKYQNGEDVRESSPIEAPTEKRALREFFGEDNTLSEPPWFKILEIRRVR